MIPAHNEQAVIDTAVNSLLTQTISPSCIIVIADNCSDDTVAVAQKCGVTVFETTGNRYKKAGALNQALELFLPKLSCEDVVLVMDADTIVSPNFIEVALQTLRDDHLAGGVSSVFVGRESNSLLGTMQRMEYHRYKREIRRHGDQAFVMSGTASLFCVEALRAVKIARDGVILPRGESYYDTESLTEDNELTFALKTLDYNCPAPGVTSVTDVMETVEMLYHQRHRWYLGALRNLKAYGLKLPWHLRWVYWRQQAGLLLSLFVISLMTISIGLVAITAIQGQWRFSVLWLLPSIVLLAERLMTVGSMGRREKVVAMLLIPEMLYSIFLLFVFASAAKDFARGHTGSWHST